MRKRFFRKAVLAAVIAVPAVFSHPDSRALAQEEGKAIEREKEAAGAGAAGIVGIGRGNGKYFGRYR